MKDTTPTLEFGCSICRKASDGICNNFCLMDKTQKQAYIKANQHLFKNAADRA